MMGRHAGQALMEYISRGHSLFGELMPKIREFVVVTVKNEIWKKKSWDKSRKPSRDVYFSFKKVRRWEFQNLFFS